MDSWSRANSGNGNEGALDFVRFCHRRRRVGWPELYDEMCAVASRGLYRGWGFVELAEHGIGFGLSEMPRLAAVASQVVREENDRRSHLLAGVMARMPGAADTAEQAPTEIGPGILVAAR